MPFNQQSVLGKEAEKLQRMFLSNDVIHKLIIGISQHILETVVDPKADPLNITQQVDETADCQFMSQWSGVKWK